MKYKGGKISLKEFIIGAHMLTMQRIPWTSLDWLDILRYIYIKLSIISYPFIYIYLTIKMLIEIIRNGRKEE